jgi:hypothetical protein
MFTSPQQNAEKNHDRGAKSFENTAKIKNLGKTAINQNYINEEITNRLNSVNLSFRSGQNLLFTPPIKNIKIKIHKTKICPFVRM